MFAIWSPEEKDAPFICIEPWFGTHLEGWKLVGDTNKYRIYKCGTVVSNLTTVENSTVEYTSHNVQNTYTIKFDANGGTGKMSSINTCGGWSVVLPKSKFTRTGYVQDGWIDEYGRIYTENQKVLNICETHKGTVIVKPRWKRAL